MPERMHDIFGPGSNVSNRVVSDMSILQRRVTACRELGLKVVLTSGTFDLFHVGHSRYLEQAKECGDVLIVGVDSDGKVKKKKGPHRPVVPEGERMEILCHSRYVDLVVLKGADEERWLAIRTVRPDVLVATKETYSDEDLVSLKDLCGKVVVLEPQATTSTTARIRSMLVGPIEQVKARLRAAFQDVEGFLDTLTGAD